MSQYRNHNHNHNTSQYRRQQQQQHHHHNNYHQEQRHINNKNNNSINHHSHFQNGTIPQSIFESNRFGDNINNNIHDNNSQSMNSRIVPQLNINQNNQLENIMKQQQEQQKKNGNNTKSKQEYNDEYIPLREDVKLLKIKVNEIISERRNKEILPINNIKLKELNESLLKLYSLKYLKHPDDINTSAAREQLLSEGKKPSEINNNDILIPSSKQLGEITILGQVLYLLALYELEIGFIEISHKYTIRALMYWRCANQHAKRIGCTTKPKYSANKSLLNQMFGENKTISSSFCKFANETNLDIDDLGFFWPQLVQCYILAGNVFLKHFEYDVSDLMFRTSLELCHCMEGRLHFSCIDSLEHLMTQMIIKHDIISSIVYAEEILNILKNNIIYNRYKYLNTKMIYCCLLRLMINDNKLIKIGLKLKEECIKDCETYFGKDSNTMFNLYIYFIKHCIQFSASLNTKKHGLINDNDIDDENLKEADIMLDYLSNKLYLNRKDKKLKFYEEYHLCRLFEEYLFILIERAILFYGQTRKVHSNQYHNSHGGGSWKPNIIYIKRIKWLYSLHIKHVDNLNNNPESSQFQRQMKMNRHNVEALYVDAYNAYQDRKTAQELKQSMAKRYK